jgi:hypothetical protein
MKCIICNKTIGYKEGYITTPDGAVHPEDVNPECFREYQNQ